MRSIGLTGGIASGKSTVTQQLVQYGAAAIDADKLGHQTYEPGTDTFQQVVHAFGQDIVAPTAPSTAPNSAPKSSDNPTA